MRKYTPFTILFLCVCLCRHCLYSQSIQSYVLNPNEINVVAHQFYDYDQDGDQDIVALERIQGKSWYEWQVVWLENDVFHQFVNKKVISLAEVPIHANYLAVQDYNKDGLPDFLIACSPREQEQGKLLLYYAQKNGSFQRKILTQPFSFTQIDHQDLNKDGRIDLLVSGFRLDSIRNNTAYYHEQQELFSFLNLKNGFSIKPINTEGNPIVHWSAADLNKDGFCDIAYVANNQIQCLSNAKNGSFRKGATITVTPTAGTLFNLNIADLNNDTYPEICWVQNHSNGLVHQYVDLKNDHQIKNLSIKSQPRLYLNAKVYFIDVNKDKLPDLISNNKGTIYYFLREAGGVFVQKKAFQLIQDAPYSFVDIDLDNDLDFFSFPGDENAFWYENVNGEYQCRFISLQQMGGYAAYQFMDIDRDQNQDIFLTLSTDYKQYLVLFKNNGQGNFSNYVFPEKIYPYCVESLDVNQDGYLDPLVCTVDGALLWMHNTGKYESWTATVIDSNLNTPRAMLVLDLDKDKQKDIIIGCQGDSKLVYFRNLGLGKFEKTYLDLDMPAPMEIQSADFNQDGYPDLAVLSKDSSATVRIYLNEAGLNLRILSEFRGRFGKDLVITDLNGDQKPDILYAANGHQNIYSNAYELEEKQVFALLNKFPAFEKQVLFEAKQRVYYVYPSTFNQPSPNLFTYFAGRSNDRRVFYALGKMQNGVFTPLVEQQMEAGILSKDAMPFVVSNDARNKLTELLFCVNYPFQILYFRVEQKP